MKSSKLLRRVFLAAAAIATAGAASASITISNGTSGSSISAFGYVDSQTYGEVFTAPITETLTSFTLSLDGGVGNLYGGVGTWNGGPTFVLGAGSATNLYQSSDIPSTGAQSFTFAPDVGVTAGAQYVAYLSVYGDSGANATTSMPYFPGTDNSVAGINYFVWQNSSSGQAGPRGNPSWDYFADFGPAQFSATFSAVPEPSTWAMMLVGFVGLGFAGYRTSRKTVSFAG
jgi:PEP-CTERM motif